MRIKNVKFNKTKNMNRWVRISFVNEYQIQRVLKLEYLL
jgi:hypothetical protein